MSDHYAGDLFANAASNGTGFYAAGVISSSTNSAAAGYSITYFPAGYVGVNGETTGNGGMEVAHYFGAVSVRLAWRRWTGSGAARVFGRTVLLLR